MSAHGAYYVEMVASEGEGESEGERVDERSEPEPFQPAIPFLDSDKCFQLARLASFASLEHLYTDSRRSALQAVVDLQEQIDNGNTVAAFAKRMVRGEGDARRIYEEAIASGATPEIAAASRDAELESARLDAEGESNRALWVTILDPLDDGRRGDDGRHQPLSDAHKRAQKGAAAARADFEKKQAEAEAEAPKAKRVAELGLVGSTIDDCVNNLTGKCPLCLTMFHLLPPGASVLYGLCVKGCGICSECYDSYFETNLLDDHVANTAVYSCHTCTRKTAINNVSGFQPVKCRTGDDALESLRRIADAATIQHVQTTLAGERLQDLEAQNRKLQRKLKKALQSRDEATSKSDELVKNICLSVGGVAPLRSSASGKRRAVAEPADEDMEGSALDSDDYDELPPRRKLRTSLPTTPLAAAPESPAAPPPAPRPAVRHRQLTPPEAPLLPPPPPANAPGGSTPAAVEAAVAAILDDESRPPLHPFYYNFTEDEDEDLPEEETRGHQSDDAEEDRLTDDEESLAMRIERTNPGYPGYDPNEEF
jgi:hypothetical protein